jgi:regulator of protease activity HflC (stomatin/prohibitin superfamily)
MLRQGAGLTGLQPLFDNLDYAQKLLGQIMMDVVQANYTPGKVKNILEGEEPAPLFYAKAFGKYGCTVEEGLNTTTQRQMQFAQLLQLREVGVPVPDEELLESCIVQNKKELIEAIQKQQQQQQQAQQAQLQAQMQEQEARTNLARARAVADHGLGIERASRVQENQALAIERRDQAHRD